MMVKNEEQNLPRILDSIKNLDLMDELCIFDTGSKDKTLTVARRYKAKIIKVDNLDDYYVETKFGKMIDFSKARNKSIEKATGDWLLLVDADEELINEEDKSQPHVENNLRNFLTDLGEEVEGVALKFRDQQKGKTHVQFPPPRIFRNGKVSYEGIVHNSPRFNDPAILFPHLVVLHYGFDLTKAQKKKKDDRTLGLLMRRLQDDPTDFRVFFYLAQMFGEKADYDKCIEYCIKYIRNAQYVKRFNNSIYFTMTQACMYGDKPLLADKWLGEAIRELPDDVDIAMGIIDYGVWQKKPLVVLEGAARYVRAYDRMMVDKLSSGSRFIYNFNKESLCKALFHLSGMRLQEGIFQLERLKKEMKELPPGDQKKFDSDIEKGLSDAGVSWIHKEKKEKKTIKKEK
jgi:glycosyltransferase involved in cell wall biosynthesis